MCVRESVIIDVRDSSYAPERDAVVDVRVTGPGGRTDTVRAQPEGSRPGRYKAIVQAALHAIAGRGISRTPTIAAMSAMTQTSAARIERCMFFCSLGRVV